MRNSVRKLLFVVILFSSTAAQAQWTGKAELGVLLSNGNTEAKSANAKFDKEAREQLLDIFRDASDYWGDRKIPFRCFYSFL